MNKSVIIIGISGSGKTAVSKELRRRGYIAYDIESIKGLCGMFDKKTGAAARKYDKSDIKSVKQHDWICNKSKLKKLMRKNTKGIVFYCGIVSNLIELLPLFDEVILLRASKKTLRKRLSTRKSNDFGRNPEVQEWIFSWKKWWEDRMLKRGIIVVNANQSLQKVASDILKKTKASQLE